MPEECKASQPKNVKNITNELSGALGDLGTFLPHVLASVAIVGLNPGSVLTWFGLFYIFSGWFYRIPMSVQPMKAASAAVLVQKLSSNEIAASGMIIGAVLLLLGITGLIAKLAQVTPTGVTTGIQVGLGLSLAILGTKMVLGDWLIGVIILTGMLPLLSNRRFPAALFALVAGILLQLWLHPQFTPISISFGFHLPQWTLPGVQDFERAFTMVAIPQLPLTLTNAILVTVAISSELYGKQASRVTEKNLTLTMGIANLIAAPLGGYMMCHGSGGVAAHYRFGGRTVITPLLIGFILLSLGVLLGKDAVFLFKVIPNGALGSLLFYSGIDLAMAARGYSNRSEGFVVLLVAALTLAINPAVAFLAGLIADLGIKRNLLKV
ncbi:MAG: putative sulfate/molybdate transporter [Chitinophagales bacterium]